MRIIDIINKGDDDLIIALTYVLDKTKSFIYLNPTYELSMDEEDRMNEIMNKLNEGLPLQYAIGYWDFYNLTLKVDQRALIPRFETEIIVDHLIHKDIKKDKILDIGIGSGAISLSLAYNLPTSFAYGVDIEDRALELAKENKDRLKLTNVEFFKSDLFSDVKGCFDIIISNPPYINKTDYESLDPRLYHEPKSALYGGEDGLYFYREIIKEANNYLVADGFLVFEIGYDQKMDINDLLIKSDFKNIENIKDFNGFDRFIIGQKG